MLAPIILPISVQIPEGHPSQRAVDDMFQGALEDLYGPAAGVILSGGDAALVPKAMSKILTHLSKYIPEEGFVHGYDTLTIADICIVVLTQALIPFGATLAEGAAACYGQFPKAGPWENALPAAFPAIAEWLKNEYCNLKKPYVLIARKLIINELAVDEA